MVKKNKINNESVPTRFSTELSHISTILMQGIHPIFP